ncbi:aspartyl-phosphate phosphatase Spo0E family protein [Desulfosporosinus sp. Sb-LF]|uniref:aspartyl-phosphate phosphatase Spo0E family protein n=1 Tax=Desulfosporosinus sp. Sb-LF TaxID=2560027 RepID=UPI00107EF9A6|nr:aspartyl-phosphate phosphatase Spo0E family protein [Desulfosporosinus sp. Sb-LF]TGE33993.1 aspartyl-phosphate phosphatase Spo0E family protein [Desulfosporosinus sp. Sb-LF]
MKLMAQEQQIEYLRVQMQKIASDKDLTDPRVVRVSEKLDILISEFYISQEEVKGVVEGTGFRIG